MKLPVRLDDLPEDLAEPVRDAFEAEMWGDAIDAIEDWLDESGQRPAPVLIVLAYVLIHDALDVMVDEVDELGTRALALLDEAKQPKQTAALRREIERAVRRDREHAKEASRRVEQSRTKPLESLTYQELQDLARKLGRSKKPEDKVAAARVWLLAAAHEDPAAKNNCFVHAALEFADGLDWTEAVPRLEQIIASPGDYEDWAVDYAYYRLLDKTIAETDVAAFTARWNQALTPKRADYFPFAHPHQVRYLEFAVEHGLAGIAKHLVDVVMKHRSPRERKPLQALLDRASKLL